MLMATPGMADDGGYTSWVVHSNLLRSDDRVLQAALPELKKNRPTWQDYRTEVVETNISYIVEFWLPAKEGSVNFVDGSNPSTPEVVASIDERHGALVVELEKTDLKPINVYFEK
jgi:hypothetical protein